MSERNGFEELQHDIANGYLCTGCGACKAVCETKSIQLLDEEPVLVGDCNDCQLCRMICPGKNVPMSELEQLVFGCIHNYAKNPLGICKEGFVGYAKDREIRRKSASGGLATALLLYALESQEIDGAIVSDFDQIQPWKPLPRIATSRQEIIRSAQSKYFTSPNVSVLDAAAEKCERIGFVGVPCHIHAIRKMFLQADRYNSLRMLTSKIEFLIGLCEATSWYIEGTEFLIQQHFGISLQDVCSIEYRRKTEQKDHRDRGGLISLPSRFQVTTKDGRTKELEARRAVRYFLNLFQRERCRVCLDWGAELADVSLCDVISDTFDIFKVVDEDEWRLGCTGIIVRTEKGSELLRGAAKAGYVNLLPIGDMRVFVENVGFKTKRHISTINMMKRLKYGLPVPRYS